MLVAVLLPQTALATAPAASVVAAPPAIKLACTLVVPNPLDPIAPNRAIVCKWTAPTSLDVSAYRLWRSVNAGPRHIIATVAPTSALRHADRNIRTGYTYHYFVAAIGKDGTRVARSNVASVHVARPAQALAFNCVVVIDNATTHARCHWAATTRSTAVRYVLWRSVDGGPRQVVYRTGIAGHRYFTDATVKPGQVIRYAVVALDKSGRVVAFGGPDTVHIPG
jgi:hypothetical protein